MSTDRLPAETRVGQTSLRVADLDDVANFYESVVGLAVLDRDDDRAVLGAGEIPLLALRSAPDEPARRRDETGLFHTAFRVPNREALGDALRRVRERWHLDGASDHLVSEALYLSDPAENGVEIYRDRPREEWPLGPDDRVQMDTLPLDIDAVADREQGRQRAPEGTTVGHVHLEVSSIPAARQFYVDALGLGVRQEWGDSALFVAAGEYHHHVGLNVWNGRTEPAKGRGLAWFELVVPGEGDLDALRERLDDRWVSWSEREDGIEVTDPDGIVVRVVTSSSE